MEITVVIPARNVARLIRNQLEALCHQDYQGAWEVVVVDNLSSDATAEVASSFVSRLPIRVVRAAEQPGVSHARNVGVEDSTADWLVFIDADDVADTSLLSAYSRAFEGHRLLGGHLNDWVLNDADVASWRHSFTEHGLPKAFGVVPFPVGANFAAHRSVFREVGAFDESLLRGGEEVDLAIRAYLKGIEACWVPSAIVYHRHRSTLRSLARQQYTYGRGAAELFARYQNALSLRPSTIARTVRVSAGILFRAPNLLRGRGRRGQWVGRASSFGGHCSESLRRRTWWVG